MARSTKFIGLRESAYVFINTLVKLGSDNFVEGFPGEEILLGKWADKEGNIFEEIEQTTIYSSGPVIFTCLLKNSKTKMFKWTNKQINKYD